MESTIVTESSESNFNLPNPRAIDQGASRVAKRKTKRRRDIQVSALLTIFRNLKPDLDKSRAEQKRAFIRLNRGER